MPLKGELDSSTINPVRFGAVSTGPAEFTKTDFPPAAPTTVHSTLVHLRKIVLAVMCSLPMSATAAEKPSEEALLKVRIDAPTKAQKIQEVSTALDALWKEQRKLLDERIAYDNSRRVNLPARPQGLLAQQFATEWNGVVNRFNENRGMATVGLDEYYSIQTDLERVLQKWETRLSPHLPASAEDPVFHARHTRIVSERVRLEREHLKVLMTDSMGKTWGMYPDEKKLNPNLTHEQYQRKMAELLETEEDMAMGLRYTFKYAYDSNDPKNRLKHGTMNDQGDYWQTSEETDERVEDGCRVGDCEDWGRWIYDVRAHQGKKTVVMLMRAPDRKNGHATAMWTEMDANGRYHACDLGTTGLDRNGCMYGMVNGTISGVSYNQKNRDQLQNGFSDPRSAMDAVLAKYKEYAVPMDLYDWEVLDHAFMQTNDLPSGKGLGGWNEFKRDASVQDVLSLCENKPKPSAPLPPSE